MELTLRQIIADVRGSTKLLTTDALLSDRLIASTAWNAANMIVHQQQDKRKLWNSPNIFTTIQCLKMEEIPLSECCDYQSDRKVARSIITLPTIGEGIFGLAVQYVTGLDNMKSFKETTPKRYANILKLGLSTNDLYFWIQNNKLVVSNSDTELITVSAYFTEDVPNSILFPDDCNCKEKPSSTNLCTNPLDKPFKFMANRVKDLEDLIIDRLNKTFIHLKEEKTSDNKEDNG